MGGVFPRGQDGTTAGKVAGTVVSRQERRTKTGNKMGIWAVHPTGQYEAGEFSRKAWPSTAICSSPGTAVLLFLSARVQGDESARAFSRPSRSMPPLPNWHKGLRVSCAMAPRRGRRQALEPASRAANERWRRSVVLMLRRHRGRGEAARPLQGLAADRRPPQSVRAGAGRGHLVISASCPRSPRTAGVYEGGP